MRTNQHSRDDVAGVEPVLEPRAQRRRYRVERNARVAERAEAEPLVDDAPQTVVGVRREAVTQEQPRAARATGGREDVVAAEAFPQLREAVGLFDGGAAGDRRAV